MSEAIPDSDRYDHSSSCEEGHGPVSAYFCFEVSTAGERLAAMMGFKRAPALLFYDFCLDEHVPRSHAQGALTATSTWMTSANR
jgi:hypothetical protein